MAIRRAWALGTAAAILLIVGWIVLTTGLGELSVRRIIRWTARTSLLFFSAALVVPALPAARGLGRHRPGLLLSLAESHGVHLGAIFALAVLTGGQNLMDRAHLLGFGVIAYVAIFAAAWRPEARLVGVGLLWVWVVFAAGFLPRARRWPLPYAIPAAVLVAALPFHVFAMLRARPLPQTREPRIFTA